MLSAEKNSLVLALVVIGGDFSLSVRNDGWGGQLLSANCLLFTICCVVVQILAYNETYCCIKIVIRIGM